MILLPVPFYFSKMWIRIKHHQVRFFIRKIICYLFDIPKWRIAYGFLYFPRIFLYKMMGYSSFSRFHPNPGQKIKIFGLKTSWIYQGRAHEWEEEEEKLWFAQAINEKGEFLHVCDYGWKNWRKK